MKLSVRAVGLHFLPLRANRDALGGNVNITRFAGTVLLGTNVQINEGLYALVIQKPVNGLGIMSGIEQHLVYRAQSESLLEFDRADDQTDSVVPGSRLQSGVQRQIVCAVRRRDHVQVIPVEESLPGAVPARVAVGLGVQTRMVAFGYTAGTTIAGRFASGIGGSGDGRAIAGRAERREIPEQTELRRDGEDLGLKKSNSLSAGSAVIVSA